MKKFKEKWIFLEGIIINNSIKIGINVFGCINKKYIKKIIIIMKG